MDRITETIKNLEADLCLSLSRETCRKADTVLTRPHLRAIASERQALASARALGLERALGPTVAR